MKIKEIRLENYKKFSKEKFDLSREENIDYYVLEFKTAIEELYSNVSRIQDCIRYADDTQLLQRTANKALLEVFIYFKDKQ